MVNFQDGEAIDYTWTRVKTHKNYLKMKNVKKDDTGVFICRGVNGFGSVSVRVDLIVTGESSLINFQSFTLVLYIFFRKN